MKYPFDNKQPITNPFGNGHTGIDFGTPIQTKVYAIEDSVVDYDDDYNDIDGIGVTLTGESGRWRYWHFTYNVVGKGQQIKEGQVLGYSGNTGISSGPHTHIDLLKDGQFVDWLQKLEDYMNELEQVKGWLKACGDHARTSLKNLGFLVRDYQVPDLEAVKKVSSHAEGLNAQLKADKYKVRYQQIKTLVNKPI